MKTMLMVGGLLAALLATIAPAHAEDDRQPIVVSGDQGDMMRVEMRAFLVAVQDIILALAEGDMPAVAESARSVSRGRGMGGGMGRTMPMEFHQMGRGTHIAFEELAQAAEFGPEGVMGELGTLMSNCTGCHATFKLVVK